MAQSHVVYPGDLGTKVEQAADDRDQSVSAFYKECARRELQRMETEDTDK